MIATPRHATGLRFILLSSKVLLGCLAATLPALAQQPLQTLLVGVDRRSSNSLNGDWHYLVDQVGSALYTLNGEINDNSYALNTHPNIVGKHNAEYDFATAPQLKVPGDWNTEIPQLFTMRASSGINATST